MQTPTASERHALDAAIAVTCSEALDPATLPSLDEQRHRYLFLDGTNFCYSRSESAAGISIDRYHQTTERAAWRVREDQVDQYGRRWSRSSDAVVDDFGTLVEVA